MAGRGMQNELALRDSGLSVVAAAAAKQQWFSGLVVADRCVAAVARATAATHRLAKNRKVVELARVLPMAAVHASYLRMLCM